MGRIFRSTEKKLPREIRAGFDSVVGKSMYRTFSAALKAFDPGEEMIIEGIANLAQPDRWGEIILPEAWNLEKFLINPIILFEHMRGENAVGTCLSVDVRKDGLYYRAQIGNPKLAELTPKQKDVRSLLAQGILKTNSVGFIPHVVEYDEDEDVIRYTDVELLEISLVTIPMQQDSVITSVKSWRKKAMDKKPEQTKAADEAAADADKEDEEEAEPTIADLKKALEENTALTKGCHEILTKAAGKSADDDAKKDEDEKKLREEIATLKTKNTALTAEVDGLRKSGAALLEKLRVQGLLK